MTQTAEEVTPNSVEATLLWLYRALDQAQVELADLDEAFVVAKHAYEVAHARAFLTAEGSMDVRKYIAINDTQELRFAAEIAEQQVRKGRERLRTLGMRAEIARSMRASVGAAMSLGGGT